MYELVWMRLSMAQFGVTTSHVSIVLSKFMAGLEAGSWATGAVVRARGQQLVLGPLQLYALAEHLIGVSAVVVSMELAWAHRTLAGMAQQVPISSGAYYLVAGTFLKSQRKFRFQSLHAEMPIDNDPR